MQIKKLMTIATMWMVFVFGLGNLCSGQSYWKKTFGDAATNEFSAIQPTSDGNYLIVGYTIYKDSTNYYRNGWLIKIKPNGDTLLTKTYSNEAGYNEFFAIQSSTDGNFLIAGSGSIFTSGLIKIKPNGDTIWTKTYGVAEYAEYNVFSAIQPSTDGNFLIIGTDGTGGWLVKINPNGDTLWTKMYGGAEENNQFFGILPTGDGNFLIVGCKRFVPGFDGGWLVKIKPNGDTLWTKTYYGTGDAIFSAIQPTTDGNFLIAGRMDYYGWLLKIKPNGDALWTKTYYGTGDTKFSAIQPTGDGNFLITGYTNYKGWLIKIKPNGDTLWTKTYGGFGENFSAIRPTTDGNFLIIGAPSVLCIIADQYAFKDSRFTYKIPVYSTDTLSFAYLPLKVPSGMIVSAGGTVSWTPKTDSIYMDHAEFMVMNDLGRKDTLTFNIFVNSEYFPPLAVKPSKVNKPDSKPFEINATLLSGKVKFSMPSFVKSISIYDINGRQIGKAAPIMSGSEACVIWPGATSSSSAIPTGKYIAKASAGMNSAAKPFVLVR